MQKNLFDICCVWWQCAKKTGGKCLQMSFIAFLWCKNIQGMNDMIYVTIRCLYVATCQENEEKLDFWKKIFQWRWYNMCKWYLLLFYDAKTSRESNHMLHMTIQCVNLPTSHQKDEKVDFSSNFGVYLASFLTTPKILKNFFSRPKKTGGNLSKI